MNYILQYSDLATDRNSVGAVQVCNRGVIVGNGKLCYDQCHLCLWACHFFFFFKDRQAFDCLNSCCLSFRICQAEEKVLKGQSLFASSAGHTRHTFGEERREPRALNGWKLKSFHLHVHSFRIFYGALVNPNKYLKEKWDCWVIVGYNVIYPSWNLDNHHLRLIM